jgi:hypothetical protein
MASWFGTEPKKNVKPWYHGISCFRPRNKKIITITDTPCSTAIPHNTAPSLPNPSANIPNQILSRTAAILNLSLHGRRHLRLRRRNMQNPILQSSLDLVLLDRAREMERPMEPAILSLRNQKPDLGLRLCALSRPVDEASVGIQGVSKPGYFRLGFLGRFFLTGNCRGSLRGGGTVGGHGTGGGGGGGERFVVRV